MTEIKFHHIALSHNITSYHIISDQIVNDHSSSYPYRTHFHLSSCYQLIKRMKRAYFLNYLHSMWHLLFIKIFSFVFLGGFKVLEERRVGGKMGMLFWYRCLFKTKISCRIQDFKVRHPLYSSWRLGIQ